MKDAVGETLEVGGVLHGYLLKFLQKHFLTYQIFEYNNTSLQRNKNMNCDFCGHPPEKNKRLFTANDDTDMVCQKCIDLGIVVYDRIANDYLTSDTLDI